ncbi:MAG: hypothetical protein U5K74_08655 [Gemmatimonadaceae bacterium]|nr:hypothetical protein [Gemmatimonadaceae bacterium]
MLQGDGVLQARLQGAWLDRTLDYAAAVQLDGEAVRIGYDAADPKVIEIAIRDLRGAVMRDGALSLHLTTGSAVVLSDSPHLDGLRNRLEAAVCVFPAQTLSLRGFGSERSAPGSDHDQWFDLLLTSRRVAEESRTVETQRRAFDAAQLVRHAQITRESWATARFEGDADRRALVAELEEIGGPYSVALRQLEHAALRLRQASGDRQFETWRRWTGTVQRAFRAADDVWSQMVPVLCDSRGAQGALWRRLLRRPGSGR